MVGMFKVLSQSTGEVIGLLQMPESLGERLLTGVGSLSTPIIPSSGMPCNFMGSLTGKSVAVSSFSVRRTHKAWDSVYIDGIDPFELNNREGWAFIPFYFVPVKASP
jgi:hypothetical protein